METALDDNGLLANLSNELNYRLALTLNNLVLIAANSLSGTDSTVSVTLGAGTYLTAQNLRTIAQQLAAVNVRPFEGNSFAGLIHPLVTHDLFNDASFGGITDLYKRNPETQKRLFAALDPNDTFEFAGIKFKETSTLSPSTISGNLYYPTYVFGDDALFSIFLGPNPTDKSKKNYSLNIQMAPAGGSVSDPAGQIGGWASYNVKFTVSPPPGAVMRARIINSNTSSS